MYYRAGDNSKFEYAALRILLLRDPECGRILFKDNYNFASVYAYALGIASVVHDYRIFDAILYKKVAGVDLAEKSRETYHTNDPFDLAEIFGIKILERDHWYKGFKAQAVKFKGYAPYIAINANYTESSKKVLCAHELGHIFLHNETLNYFSDIGGKINMETEYEANLFVLALLEDQARLKVDMTEISPYLLQTIIEQNVERKQDK